MFVDTSQSTGSNTIIPNVALTLGGGTLQFNAGAGGQTLASTALVAGTGNYVQVLGTTFPLTMGAVTYAAGATVDFTLPSGAQSGGNGILITLGTNTTVGGILTALRPAVRLMPR